MAHLGGSFGWLIWVAHCNATVTVRFPLFIGMVHSVGLKALFYLHLLHINMLQSVDLT